MNFQTKILLVSFICNIILSIIVIPILKKLKVGQMEREDGPKSHLKKQGTPTMGGIIITISLILLGGVFYLSYSKTEPQVAQKLIPLLILIAGCGLIGFIDDFIKLVLKNTKGLKPSLKMLGLLIIAGFYTIYTVKFQNAEMSIMIPFVNNAITLPIWVYIPFTIFVILAVTNAVNLTDGIDGLATSVSLVIILCLSVISIILDIKEVTIVGSILLGACLSFLLFNLHPAKVFMGDTGSLLLGAAIAGMAISMQMPFIILIVAIVPVIEAISVIVQVLYFKKTGKRILKMAPFHHHLELSGWSENKVVITFSLLTLIFSCIAILSI